VRYVWGGGGSGSITTDEQNRTGELSTGDKEKERYMRVSQYFNALRCDDRCHPIQTQGQGRGMGCLFPSPSPCSSSSLLAWPHS
jgi:hypothetical protein